MSRFDLTRNDRDPAAHRVTGATQGNFTPTQAARRQVGALRQEDAR